VIKNSYAHNANESKVYAGLVWGRVLIGIIVLLAGFDQPILLLVISAVVGGHDVHLFRVVDLDQPQESARADQGQWIPAGGADLGDRSLRNAVGADFRDQLGKLFGG
jgi:hypothetical protein